MQESHRISNTPRRIFRNSEEISVKFSSTTSIINLRIDFFSFSISEDVTTKVPSLGAPIRKNDVKIQSHTHETVIINTTSPVSQIDKGTIDISSIQIKEVIELVLSDCLSEINWLMTR